MAGELKTPESAFHTFGSSLFSALAVLPSACASSIYASAYASAIFAFNLCLSIYASSVTASSAASSAGISFISLSFSTIAVRAGR